MDGPSWLVDGNRFATKIKCASGACDPGKINFNSNPRRHCPKCNHVIDNSDITQEWPGLPRGVKFDPSDQEIIWHLLAKSGHGDQEPHPFIDEFILTINGEDGICYTHPQNLPGVKQDGSAAHFFHRSVKAYNTGTRKRRKIHDDLGDVRWHKTGRTRPVFLGSEQRGCKKIMVLYTKNVGGDNSERTNWKLHQYHLGTGEEEKDGDFVISKVFYDQQQQAKTNEKNPGSILNDEVAIKVDPVTPKSVTPQPRTDRHSSCEPKEQPIVSYPDYIAEEDVLGLTDTVQPDMVRHGNEVESRPDVDEEVADPNNDEAGIDTKWWDSESQYLIDSQQLVEGLSLCDDLLQSQSPNRDGHENGAVKNKKPGLSDYAQLGAEQFKRDLQECQRLEKEDLDEESQNIDLANIEIDTPPDFRLSQLEFASQDSYIAWGGS